MSLASELLFGNDIEQIPDPAPLIEGVLDLDSTALLYGSSGAGKSLVALDQGLCVASDTPWHGHAVHQGPVLYVLGEGLSGTRARYMAWKHQHDLDAVEHMVWGPHAVNVRDQKGRDDLMEAVLKAEPVLTILDTIARHIPGGDENSFETMSYMVEMLDWIRRETGGCAEAVHHAGKNVENGARGHSSLKGAMDTEILCTKGPILTLTKQKNHADGHMVASFEMVARLDSMILQLKDRPTNRNNDLAIQALVQLGGDVRFGEWKATAVQLGMKAGSFDRTRKRLLEEAILTTDTTDTDTGEIRYRLLEP